MEYEIVRKLESYEKDYFTINDLEKILRARRDSLKVKLVRLVKKKVLLRLRRGIYVLADKPIKADKLATQIFQPSYVSFEFALARYGLLGQIPYTVTLASPRLCLKTNLANFAIEIRKIKKSLFGGYVMQDGVLIATPEKALLDMLYMISFGKSSLDLSELTLRDISKKKALALSRRYPEVTQRLLEKSVKKFF